MDKFNPFNLLLKILIKGIILGVILAIAIPVKRLIDSSVRRSWARVESLFRKKVTVVVNKKSINI